MTVQEQIDQYISSQVPAKRDDLLALHAAILKAAPDCRLWFLDGRNDDGKVVSNPNIGYGETAINYANGETRDFYRIGLSANATGISVYVMGLDDKTLLSDTYGARLGKAKITGYCVKFRSTKDLNLEVLDELFASQLGDESARTP